MVTHGPLSSVIHTLYYDRHPNTPGPQCACVSLLWTSFLNLLWSSICLLGSGSSFQTFVIRYTGDFSYLAVLCCLGGIFIDSDDLSLFARFGGSCLELLTGLKMLQSSSGPLPFINLCAMTAWCTWRFCASGTIPRVFRASLADVYFAAPVTVLAAKLWTLWSFSSSDARRGDC